ncbi:hypothetical protein ACHAPT_012147 [Fusarium lateritium]
MLRLCIADLAQADRIYREDPNLDHEYLPIAGLPDFNKAAQKLILGGDSPAIKEDRVCTFQAISGTGAVHLGAAFLSKFLHTPKPTVYISDPTWPIHNQVFTHVGLTVQHYPYFSQSTKMMDFNGMISCLQKAARGSIVVLHACAHNQTGVDLTEDQWRRIAQVMRESDLFPFFDCAYQGFATGSLTKDNFAIRYFLEEGFNMVIAQSFAKNFGLYGQRAGAVHVVTAPGPTAQDMTKRIASQLSIISRSEMSSPPIYGAKLVSIVLNDTQLFREWQENLLTMSGRIIDMRVNLKQDLDRLQTPGNWDHITSQVGMFTFTGLNASQVCQMKGKWHVYMAGNGRISMAGLNKGNVKYFAKAIDSVVRYPN